MPTLIKRDDGFLYVRDSYGYQDEPIERVMDWPTGLRACNVREDLVGAELKRHWDGVYYTLSIRQPTGAPFRISLPQDGDTQAAFVEERPIAPPKVRKGTELRWNGPYCRWDKYSKREGWIPA